MRPQPRSPGPITISEVTSLIEFELGDWVPCEKEVAEFEVTIIAVNNESLLNSWSEWFCRYDGTNADPAYHDMMSHGYNCSAGSSGGCSGSTNILEPSDEKIGIEVDWFANEEAESFEFSATLCIQPGHVGQIHLDENRLIKHRSIN